MTTYLSALIVLLKSFEDGCVEMKYCLDGEELSTVFQAGDFLHFRWG
jgi:hypothetical protein